MTVSVTERLGLYRWSSSEDAFNRNQVDVTNQQLEARAVGFVQGTERPAATSAYKGYLFTNENTSEVSYCTGSSWIILSGYGSPSALAGDSSTNAGASTSFSRSDHIHAMPGFAAPVSTGVANSAGVAATLARSDHEHAVGTDSVVTSSIASGAVTDAKIASGITASKISGNISGKAAGWTTSRTITLGGGLSGSVGLDGTANVTLTATVTSVAGSAVTGAISGNSAGWSGSRTLQFSGDVNDLNVAFSGPGTSAVALTVKNDSHTHDTQYYTKTNIDTKMNWIFSRDGAAGGRGIYIQTTEPVGSFLTDDIWIKK